LFSTTSVVSLLQFSLYLTQTSSVIIPVVREIPIKWDGLVVLNAPKVLFLTVITSVTTNGGVFCFLGFAIFLWILLGCFSGKRMYLVFYHMVTAYFLVLICEYLLWYEWFFAGIVR